MTIDILKRLIEARKAYYNSDQPIMTDQEFDALEGALKNKDPNHPYFETIGHEPSQIWKSAKHSIRMGSLEKVHSQEEFLKWASKFKEELFIFQLKLDGLSVSLDYKDSVFVRAITRGDGSEGDDISPNVRLMINFKEILSKNTPFTGSVRAEIILNKENFNKINSTLEDEVYSNTRNAASGISRRLDGKYCKYLTLLFYDLTESLDERDKNLRLSDLGLTLPDHCIEGDVKALLNQFEVIKDLRSSLPYDIDGVVIKVNSRALQDKAGVVRNKPKYQMAWKFEPPGATTIFLKETWDVGRTGVVTPLGHVEPVFIEGSVISRVTLHNIAEIKRLGIGRGDTVMLIKAGEIIPKITSVLDHKGCQIEIPTKCPSCESDLLNDQIKLICPSEVCPRKQFNRILNWIKVTEIDAFGEALADALNAQNKLKKISDIYKLKREDISSIEGWGNLSADTILNNIEKSKKLSPKRLLSAIGIPGISERTSEELLNIFKSIDHLMSTSIDEIKTLKGFSDISASNIVTGLKKYKEEIIELLTIIDISEQSSAGPLNGKNFCFTGAMNKPRAQYQALVEQKGGRNLSTVTKDLTYLICNEDKGSSKTIKAQKFGIKILNEKEFLELIGDGLNSDKPEIKIEPFTLFEEQT